MCSTSQLRVVRIQSIDIRRLRRGERWGALWMLRPGTLDIRGLLQLLLGIREARRHRLLTVLRSRHGPLRILWSRRNVLLTLLLPWPLQVEWRELLLIHGLFTFVGEKDHVDIEQHQGREKGFIWMKNCVVVDQEFACSMEATYVEAER